jgi:hypothetical protein
MTSAIGYMVSPLDAMSSAATHKHRFNPEDWFSGLAQKEVLKDILLKRIGYPVVNRREF